MTADLQALCEQAMREGRQVDLQGCSYGSRFLKKEFLNAPVDYYFLLAGLVRTLDLKHILELGTHWGGAIKSMCRGLRHPDSPENRLVTVDINYKNADGFGSYPQIKRITGDSFDRRIMDAVVASFPGPLDLLFVDTDHDYRQTYRNLATYGNRLAPRLMVLDDIHLNHSMDRLWRDLKDRMGNRAFDASHLCNREVGFGILLCDPTVSWPERYGFLIDYWRARRWVLARVPERFRHFG